MIKVSDAAMLWIPENTGWHANVFMYEVVLEFAETSRFNNEVHKNQPTLPGTIG